MGDIVRMVRRGKFIGWYVRYKDADSRRRMRASHQPTQAQARRFLLEIEGRVARGLIGIPEPQEAPPTFAEVMERFLAEYSRARIKDLGRYREAARMSLQRVLPLLGNRAITKIALEDLVRAQIMLSQRYAPRTARLTLDFLGVLFNWAVRKNLITKNLIPGVEKPLADPSLEYLSREDAHRLIACSEAASQHSLAGRMRHVCLLFALHTGLRKGELLGLRWLDLDLESRRLSVMKSYKTTPKSGKPRHLRLPSLLIPLLGKWKRECPHTPGGLVFPVILRDRAVAGRDDHLMGLNELLEQAGCRRLLHPWHALRHTYASHFIMAGGNILALQKILGHADLTMTMVYAHLAPDFLGDEMDRVKFR
jgi:integrase